MSARLRPGARPSVVEPEEIDPGLLVGRHVVEVGMRQAWPFLTLADPVTGREVRIYVDASVRVSPDVVPLRQDDNGLLLALDRVNMLTVDSARAVEGALELTLEDHVVWIDGQENELTTHTCWWVGPQSPGQAPLPPGTGPMTDGSSHLLAASHLPLSFAYPPDFLWVVARGLVDLEPWTILRGEELARKLLGLRKRYPDSPLVPFASRIDNDDVACWDTDLPRGRVVIVHDWASPGWERRAQHDDFTSWFRSAVEDCLELGDLGG